MAIDVRRVIASAKTIDIYTYRIRISCDENVATKTSRSCSLSGFYTGKVAISQIGTTATIKPARVVVIASWFRVERGARHANPYIVFPRCKQNEIVRAARSYSANGVFYVRHPVLMDLQMPLATTLPVTVHLRAKTCRGNDFIVQPDLRDLSTE